MKRLVTLIVTGVFAAAMQVVQAATWTGLANNGLWNDPNNWGGAVPAANEDVTISPTAAVVITLPNVDIDVGTLTAKGSDVKISGSNWFAVKGVDATAYLDLDVRLNMNPAASSFNLNFGGGADVRKAYNVAPYKSVSMTAGRTVNFWGTFTGGAYTYFICGAGTAGSTTGETIHFYGALNVAYSMTFGGNTYKSGWVYFHAPGNLIGELRQSYTTVHAMSANAFSHDLVLQWKDDQFTEEARNHCSYDFHGNDQTINRISASTVRSSKDDSRKIYSTGGAMTLTLAGTADATARVRVNDAISLVWAPSGDFTQEFQAYPSAMTGSITVKGGTFKVSQGATFADVSAVTIDDGATFDLNSTAYNALGNVPEINLDGTLKIAATAMTPFGRGQTALRIGANGTIEVPAGMNVKVKMAEKGSMYLAAKTYKAIGSSATGEECNWVSGGGTVQVMSMGETHETCTWTGAANNGLWNDPDNWSAGVVPQSCDTANFTTNATIVDGFSVDNDRAISIAQGCTVQLNGTVSGGADIICEGNGGVLELYGENTFSGDLIVSNSIVRAYGRNALSTSSAGAIRVIKDGHAAGANLQLSGVTVRKTLYNANKNDGGNLWGYSILCREATTNRLEGALNCTDSYLRMNVAADAQLTIAGGASFPSCGYFIARQSGAEVIVSNTAASFPVFDNSDSASDAYITFACAGNAIGTGGGLVATRGIGDAMRTTVDNAFTQSSHCYFGGANAKLDLCGHDQQFGRIMAMSGKVAGVICSEAPATLTLKGDETYVNNAIFQGQVSLTKNGTGTVTLQSVSTSAGDLSVGGGTLALASGASWAGTHLDIADGAILDVADKNAFGEATAICITGTGYLNIPVGVTLRCRELTVDGKMRNGICRNNGFVKGGGILKAGRIGFSLIIK